MEEYLKELLFEYKNYAYLILFAWCLLEGEMALIFGGILAHEGHIDLSVGIFVAGLGAFCGDQFYFYVGRYNKKYITNKLSKQRHKFAIAHLLLQRYGWPIIFFQRYAYGFRTVIPMSIGITRYSSNKFGIINFISGMVWAGVTMVLAWYFGKEIWKAISWAEAHWYYAILLIGIFLFSILYAFRALERRFINLRKERVK